MDENVDPRNLFIVIPVFRDMTCARMLLEKLEELPRLNGYRRLVILVDDSAGQEPMPPWLDSMSGVEVLVCPRNLGHQGALVFGLRQNRERFGDEDLIVTMDSDGEDRPEDLPRLFAALDPSNKRLVLAKRQSRTESAVFKICHRIFILIFYVLVGRVIQTGNFAVLPGCLVRRQIGHPNFDYCYSASLIRLNPDAILIPCPKGSRYAGKSRMGYRRLVLHGLRMMIPFWDIILVRLGVLCALGAAVFAAWRFYPR